VDLGSDEEARKLIQVSRTNRWIWTIAVLMVPIGLFVLAFGVDRGDPIIKVVGGTLLLTAIVMAVYKLFPERKDH
jgi:membrane protein YdbS with pleckstrin-like domain